jgi:hypothetical protein
VLHVLTVNLFIPMNLVLLAIQQNVLLAQEPLQLASSVVMLLVILVIILVFVYLAHQANFYILMVVV